MFIISVVAADFVAVAVVIVRFKLFKNGNSFATRRKKKKKMESLELNF